jgi:hypothetical protein
MIVYVVEHDYGSDDDDNYKLIGVYSSETNAAAAVERLSFLPVFSDHRDGFTMGPMVLDMDYWSGGFFTFCYIDEETEEGM